MYNNKWRHVGPILNFKKRAARGEILVRPMRASNLKILSLPFRWSLVTKGDSWKDFKTLAHWTVQDSIPGAERIVRVHPDPISWGVSYECRALFPSEQRHVALDGYANVQYGVFKFGLQKANYPSPVTVDLLADKIHGLAKLGDPDTALVTDVLSKANSGDWDILTSLLEFDKTVRWIADIIKRVIAICNLFRGKHDDTINFFTKKAHSRKRPEPPAPFGNRTYANLKLTKAQRAHERRAWSNYRKQLREWKKAQKADKLHLIDQLASLRLQVEYALAPLLREWESIKTALKNVNDTYATHTSNKKITERITEFEGFKGEITLISEERCWLKRSYTAHTFVEGLLNRGSFAIGVTALELIPYLGIVINWVFNLGDWLSAQSFNASYDQQRVTYSKKTTVNGRISHPYDGSLEIAGREIYELRIIDPRDWLNCRPVDSFSVQKALNGFALGWVALRSSAKVPTTAIT